MKPGKTISGCTRWGLWNSSGSSKSSRLTTGETGPSGRLRCLSEWVDRIASELEGGDTAIDRAPIPHWPDKRSKVAIYFAGDNPLTVREQGAN